MIPETCAAIWTVLQLIYLSAMQRNDWQQVALKFLDQWNFPNCLGAIQSKLPPKQDHYIINIKNFSQLF